MKSILILASLALLPSNTIIVDEKKDAEMELAVLCFFDSEETSGLNKICYYDCLGSKAAITIKSVKLCPLSIES